MSEEARVKAPVELFFSYAHEDEKLRDQLAKHLRILERNGIIAGWHDREIIAGHDWETEIDQHLNTAKVILLLISADFVDSNYCYGIEMKRALERHEAEEARVIPVILRDVYWRGTPFGKLQALPKDAKAVTKWEDRDSAFKNVAEGIARAVEEIRRAPASTVSRPSAPANTQITSASTEVASFRTSISANKFPSPIATNTPASPTLITYPFIVCKLTDTNVVLRRGDKVKIVAAGMMDTSISNVGPEGKRSSFLPMCIPFIRIPIPIDAEKYNIVPDYPHGMLMYRVQPGGSTSTVGWEKCGGDCEFFVKTNGTLELEVNVNGLGDNTGEFLVTVTVERY